MMNSDNVQYSAKSRAPSNALYRSRIEICRILRGLARDESPVFAELGEEQLFVTKILVVDDSAGYLVIEYGADKSINSALFERHTLGFRASHSGAHLAFRVANPLEIMLEGGPAIRFALPNFLVWSNRREHPRTAIPPHVPLRCIFRNADGELFKTDIFDISLDGMGGMISDGNVALQVGTVLKGCRITYPGGEPITADLVVRNLKTVTRSDGTLFTRTGVRFIQRPDEIQALINFFVHDLDGKGT
ncbi:MAG: flagellar brake protein [Nitrosomonadales bacterium]|nr:flagellar brake protein [Nitrosomonadales bacterium]